MSARFERLFLGKGVALERSLPEPIPDEPPERFQSQRLPVGHEWIAHPGRRLTPERILSAFAEAEQGDPEQQCDLFDDRIEHDAHLRDALQGRVESVALKQWMVIPGGDRPSDKRAAELLERALRRVPSWRAALAHQAKAFWYGYSYAELVWDWRDGKIVPIHLETVDHRRFAFNARDRPLVRTVRSDSGEELLVGKWWHTEPRLFGRRVAMGGLMRTAVWWSMFKTMSVRDWIVFANRFGLPYAWAEYPRTLRPEDKAALKLMMQQLGTDGWATFQEGVKVHLVESAKSGGSTEVHGALTELCNREISKLIIGSTLTNETQGPGSYALGSVHGERSFARIAGDAELIADSFEQQVGFPFVLYNGMPAQAPRLKIHVVRDMDPLSRAEVFRRARNELGVPVSMSQVRQELQLKPPVNPEDAVPGQGASNGQTPADAPADAPDAGDSEDAAA